MINGLLDWRFLIVGRVIRGKEFFYWMGFVFLCCVLLCVFFCMLMFFVVCFFFILLLRWVCGF